MRGPRVYCDSSLSEGREIGLDDERSHYLAHVLRLAPGAPIVLFNGRREFAGRVLSLGRRTARVLCERELAPLPASRLQLSLYLSVAKGRSMDFAVQKATELGAASIQPVLAARSVAVAGSRERWERKLAHWEGIARNACEQCGRAALPRIARPTVFDRIVPPQGAVAFTLDPDGGRSLVSVARRLPGACVAVLVGPEGGLTEDEVRVAREKGFTPVSLGPRLLRVETAVAAALSVLQALCGDLGDDLGGDSAEVGASDGCRDQ